MNKEKSILVDGREFVSTQETCRILDIPPHTLYHFIHMEWCSIETKKENIRLYFNKDQVLETRKELKDHVHIVEFIKSENINRDVYYRHRRNGKLPKPKNLTYIRYSRPSFYTKKQAKDVLKFLEKLGSYAFKAPKDKESNILLGNQD